MNEQNTPNPNRQKKHTISNKVRNRLVAVATAAPLLLLAACSGSDQTSAASERGRTIEALEAPTPEQVEKAKEQLKPGAVEAAITVLDILDDPDSGAESYTIDGYSLVGNKAAIVGSDLHSGTIDDAEYSKYPESLASFSPETRTIIVRAIAMHGDTANPAFWSVETKFLVGADNPILTEKGRLSPTDFVQALSEEDVEVVSASTLDGYTYDEAVNTGHSASLDFEGGITGEIDQSPLGTGVLDTIDPDKFAALAGELSATLGDVAAKLETDTK